MLRGRHNAVGGCRDHGFLNGDHLAMRQMIERNPCE
jgi:hypothetical protein